MNITFRQLRLFLATAETGSVSAAARALHVTQPTASMQLREITESVGMPLYDIIGRKLYLTDAGQALAQTARQIVDEWERFEQRIHAMQGLTQGRLRACWGAFARAIRTSTFRSKCSTAMAWCSACGTTAMTCM
jgi:DNA-binding transcriptional LysR family regulator